MDSENFERLISVFRGKDFFEKLDVGKAGFSCEGFYFFANEDISDSYNFSNSTLWYEEVFAGYIVMVDGEFFAINEFWRNSNQIIEFVQIQLKTTSVIKLVEDHSGSKSIKRRWQGLPDALNAKSYTQVFSMIEQDERVLLGTGYRLVDKGVNVNYQEGFLSIGSDYEGMGEILQCFQSDEEIYIAAFVPLLVCEVSVEREGSDVVELVDGFSLRCIV